MNEEKQIEILARGVCVKEGKILLCHTKGAANTYLPGGHVEFMEKATESLRREIQEELDTDPAVGRFLGAVEHTFIQRNERHCEINLVFQIDLPGIESSAVPDSREDYIEFRWVPINGLSESMLEPSVLRDLLPSWLKHPSTPDRWSTTYGAEL